MCVRARACVRACVFICVGKVGVKVFYVRVRAGMYARVSVYVDVCMRACVYIHACVCVDPCLRVYDNVFVNETSPRFHCDNLLVFHCKRSLQPVIGNAK